MVECLGFVIRILSKLCILQSLVYVQRQTYTFLVLELELLWGIDGRPKIFKLCVVCIGVYTLSRFWGLGPKASASFIHSGYFYSTSSSPLLLGVAPDYSIDTVSKLARRCAIGNCE